MDTEQFQQGQPVWWLDQLYLTGYRGYPVRGVFLKYRKAKHLTVGIAVEMADHSWRPKWVKPENVGPR